MPLSRREAARWTAALALLVAGCVQPSARSGSETGLLLVVDADEAVREAPRHLEVLVEGRGDDAEPWAVRARVSLEADGPEGWPKRGAIAPLDGAPERQVRVTVRLTDPGSGELLLVARVRTRFVPGQWRRLGVFLASSCFGARCPEGERCTAGGCVPEEVDPEALPPAVRSEPGAACSSDAQCDDGEPCTVDRCVSGRCVSGRPADGALAFRQVAVRPGTSCALDALGRLWCWGDGSVARAGGGEPGPLPVRLEEVSELVDLALGYVHACVVRRDGAVLCAGYNNYGQSGVPTEDGQPVGRFTEVAGLPPARAVAAGFATSCALAEDGTVWCWGRGEEGELGGGGPEPNRTRPGLVPGLPSATDVVSGFRGGTGSLVMARTAGGALWSWGASGGPGHLGQGSMATAAPGRVSWREPALSAATISYTSCLVDRLGRLACWGENRSGQFGSGVRSDGGSTRASPGLSADVGVRWRAVDVSPAGACALDAAGRPWCWGLDQGGSLGLGPESVGGEVLRPAPVRWTAGPAAQIAISGSHGCAVTVDGELWCWGRNGAGQLGLGDTEDRSEPARVGAGLRCP